MNENKVELAEFVEVKKAVAVYNDYVLAKRFSLLPKQAKDIKELLKECNKAERDGQLTAWASDSNPLVAMLASHAHYTLTNVKYDDKTDEAQITSKSEVVDMQALVKKCAALGVASGFASDNWLDFCEAVNFSLMRYHIQKGGFAKTEKIDKSKERLVAAQFELKPAMFCQTAGALDILQRLISYIISAEEKIVITESDAHLFIYGFMQVQTRGYEVKMLMADKFRKFVVRLLAAKFNNETWKATC